MTGVLRNLHRRRRRRCEMLTSKIQYWHFLPKKLPGDLTKLSNHPTIWSFCYERRNVKTVGISNLAPPSVPITYILAMYWILSVRLKILQRMCEFINPFAPQESYSFLKPISPWISYPESENSTDCYVSQVNNSCLIPSLCKVVC